MTNNPSKNHGFSLLEILISLVIMSVGMMGLAGLKIVAIKGENESHFRHEASLLIVGMAERIQANPAGVDNGKYKANGGIDIENIPSPLCDEALCDADQLATFDKYSVAVRMNDSLPGVELFITCPANNCTTIPAVEAGTDPVTGAVIAASPAVKKEHTIKITWKIKKQKGESQTTIVNGVSTTSDYHSRFIELKLNL